MAGLIDFPTLTDVQQEIHPARECTIKEYFHLYRLMMMVNVSTECERILEQDDRDEELREMVEVVVWP